MADQFYRAGLRSVLKRLGLNQTQAAAKIGVSQAVVSMWLSGQREPTRIALHGIATALGVDVDELSGMQPVRVREAGPVSYKVNPITKRHSVDLEFPFPLEAARKLRLRYRAATERDKIIICDTIQRLFPDDYREVWDWLTKK